MHCQTVSQVVDKLRQTIVENNLSLVAVAKEADVARPYLYRVLGGKQIPSHEWLRKVAAAIGLQVELKISEKKRRNAIDRRT